jgi:hypothetical protein
MILEWLMTSYTFILAPRVEELTVTHEDVIVFYGTKKVQKHVEKDQPLGAVRSTGLQWTL